jgi:hypothetical protein
MEVPVHLFLDLFNELYEGVKSDESWVIDAKPGDGFIRVIQSLDAEQASTPLVKYGSTIAAHTEHLRWSLNFALEFLKGNTPSCNWSESWRIHQVNTLEWETLTGDLKNACNLIKSEIETNEDWSNPFLVKGTIALVPHIAYHLGAVKQIMLALKDRSHAEN